MLFLTCDPSWNVEVVQVLEDLPWKWSIQFQPQWPLALHEVVLYQTNNHFSNYCLNIEVLGRRKVHPYFHIKYFKEKYEKYPAVHF